MTIKAFLDSCDNSVDLHKGFGLDWSVTGIGFGQLYFTVDDQGVIHCDSETMGKEFIKMVLCRMVDQCVLSD